MPPETPKLQALLNARVALDEQLRHFKAELTIMFTDVVGSTAYFDRYGDTAGIAFLHRHSEAAQQIVPSHGGRIIKMIGDSVMAEFPSPGDAAAAAVELQQTIHQLNQSLPARDRLYLRIGINSGTGFRHDQDVYGDAVNVAARIVKRCSAAQILVSKTVQAAVPTSAFAIRSIGHADFHGKAETAELFEIIWTDTSTYKEMRTALTAAVERGDLTVNDSPPIVPPTPSETIISTLPPVLVSSRYTILTELGRGGMGTVYKARDNETGETVALKLLRPALAGDASALEAFRDELRLARRITHQNVCRIYSLERAAENAFITMEFVEGSSLRELLRRTAPFSAETTLRLAIEICAGLAEAHRQGVIHRDLKPENIMIDANGRAKIMDFGIAGKIGSMPAMVAGTPGYMSPEQAAGTLVDERGDIYAFGVILFEMCTKNRPEDHQERRVLREKRVSLALASVVQRCLSEDADQRFASVDEVVEALRSDDLPVALPPSRWRKVDYALLAAALGAVILVVTMLRSAMPIASVSMTLDPGISGKLSGDIARKLGFSVGKEEWFRLGEIGRNVFDRIGAAGGTSALSQAAAANRPPMYQAQTRFAADTGAVVVGLDPSGSMNYFLHAPKRAPVGAPRPELQAEAERIAHDWFGADLGNPKPPYVYYNDAGSITSNFIWRSDPMLGGVTRTTRIGYLGNELSLIEQTYNDPDSLSYERPVNWETVTAIIAVMILIILGVNAARRLQGISRWRLRGTAIATIAGAFSGWMLPPQTFPLPLMMFCSAVIAVIAAVLWLIGSAWMTEYSVSSNDTRASSLIALLQGRCFTETTTIAIARGFLCGIALLGLEQAKVYAAYRWGHAWPDYFSTVDLAGSILGEGQAAPFVFVFAVCIAVALGHSLLMVLVRGATLSLRSRVARIVCSGVLLGGIGSLYFMSPVMPNSIKIPLLLIDGITLMAIVEFFDVLTGALAVFTFCWIWLNAVLGLMLMPLGSTIYWIGIGAWIVVAGIAALAASPLRARLFGTTPAT